MTIEERMTICNMSIEGGARAGYVNPDETTFAFLKGRRFVPAGAAFDRAVAWWRQIASDPDAAYDDRVTIDAATIEPTVTWGINPGQSVGIGERIGDSADQEALTFMGFERGGQVRGRASTSPSSDRARTGGCPIWRRPRASSAGATSRRTCGRSSCRDHRP